MVYKGLRDISYYEGHLVVMRDISCLRDLINANCQTFESSAKFNY